MNISYNGHKLSRVNAENKQKHKSVSNKYYWEILQQCHGNSKYEEEHGSSSDDIVCIICIEMKAFLQVPVFPKLPVLMPQRKKPFQVAKHWSQMNSGKIRVPFLCRYFLQ